MDVSAKTLKGMPQPVAAVFTDISCLRIENYPDGTWEIDRDGHCLGSWEHASREQCFRVFIEMANQEHGGSSVAWIATDRPASDADGRLGGPT